MSFLFVLMAVMFLSAPFLTQAVFRAGFEREKAQIQLDNAAIRLGEGDELVLQKLAEGNEKLEHWERLHHVAHACARVPGPQAAKCRMADEAWEAAIKSFHTWLGARAVLAWRESEARARSEAGNPSVTILRPRAPPLESGQCPVCKLEREWKLKGELRWKLILPEARRPLTTGVQLTRKSLEAKKRESYRLYPR